MGAEIDEESILDVDAVSVNGTEKTGTVNSALITPQQNEQPEPPKTEEQGLYYVKGKLANGVKTVNGEKINFKDGRPAAKIVKNQVYVRDAQGNLVYTNTFPINKLKTITVETIYGDDGKLVNGEYNHKMYKDGKLLTGPLDGAYYVKGVQDDTFSDKGTDGLMYENGKPLTGVRNNLYYKNGILANGYNQ